MRYHYEGIGQNGTKVSGIIKARGKKDAQKKLLNFAYLSRLEPVLPIWLSWCNQQAGTPKIKKEMLADFLLQFGTMVEAGIEIPTALTSLARYGDKQTKQIAVSLNEELMKGSSLAQAFQKNEKILGESYEAFIRMGQESGNVADVLLRLSENLSKDSYIKKKVLAALTYPAVVSSITFLISIYLFTTVVPQIVSGVQGLSDNPLPAMTLVIMAISDFILKYGGFLLAASAIGAALFLWLIRYPYRKQWHKVITSLPFFGKLICNKEMSSFYRSLSISADAGMSHLEALRCSYGGVRNLHLKQELADCGERMSLSGKTISAALEQCSYVNGIEAQSLEVGIKSGKLGQMAGFCAKRLEERNETQIRKFTALIDPIMLCVIGVIVGAIMMSVYAPIFSITQSMSAGL